MVPPFPFAPAVFLSRHWQKKPHLQRQAFPNFEERISPDELAGLSCEAGIDARIILEKGGKKPWEVRRGPFKPKVFATLPASHWTLLVNGVDRYIPSVHELLDFFRFIPNWRIDDIMISYAADKGNVGAHVDNFDVFLIQASGRREWHIEEFASVNDDYIENLDVRLLRHFKPTKKWVLEAGDMLYLPPRFAHHGIARGKDCMTYSIGFRAPTYNELFDGVVTEALSHLPPEFRYSDPELLPQHPGEISLRSRRKIRTHIKKAMLSDGEIDSWFGRFSTEPKGDFEIQDLQITAKECRQLIEHAEELRRSEGSRIAYFVANKSLLLFVNGEEFRLGNDLMALIRILSDGTKISTSLLLPLLSKPKALKLICELINRGAFYVPEEGRS